VIDEVNPVKRPKTETEKSSLMHVGRRVDYAVRAFSYLAAQPPGKIVGRAEIERRQDIPSHFLSKIMRISLSGGLLNPAMDPREVLDLPDPQRRSA